MGADFGKPDILRWTPLGALGFAGDLRRPRAAPAPLPAVIARLVAIEATAIASMAYAASAFYNHLILLRWPPIAQYVPAALLLAALVTLVSLSLRHYASLQTIPRHRFLWNGLGAVALAFSLLLTIIFLVKDAEGYSRGTFLFQFVGVSIAMLTARALSHARLQAAIAGGFVEARRAVLIGDSVRAAGISAHMRETGIQTIGILGFPDAADAGNGQVRRMIETCRTLRPDDIVLLATAAELAATARLADALSELPVSLHIVPAGSGDLLASSRLGKLGGVMTIQVLHPPLSLFDRIVKRAFDVTAAVAGLIMLAPIFLITALAIKLDSRGPIFFRQTRQGYNNDTIRVFKFRSMNVTEDGDAFRQAKKSDPRITAVGRLMRRTNIDELPQLVNVLTGEMSLVGPRPHPEALNQMFAARISPFSRRHNVKPGITGWAQVNGYRGETDTLEKMQKRLEHDLYYIDNWSFILDLNIIIMTLFSKSAYSNAF